MRTDLLVFHRPPESRVLMSSAQRYDHLETSIAIRTESPSRNNEYLNRHQLAFATVRVPVRYKHLRRAE
eukprot:scaffold637739_cov15-Prasinocladus_malaysianus.AAC.1